MPKYFTFTNTSAWLKVQHAAKHSSRVGAECTKLTLKVLLFVFRAKSRRSNGVTNDETNWRVTVVIVVVVEVVIDRIAFLVPQLLRLLLFLPFPPQEARSHGCMARKRRKCKEKADLEHQNTRNQ